MGNFSETCFLKNKSDSSTVASYSIPFVIEFKILSCDENDRNCLQPVDLTEWSIFTTPEYDVGDDFISIGADALKIVDPMTALHYSTYSSSMHFNTGYQV